MPARSVAVVLSPAPKLTLVTPLSAVLLPLLLTMLLLGCGQSSEAGSATTAPAVTSNQATPASSNPGSPAMVRVRVINPEGVLAPAAEVPKLVLTDEQWKQRLTPEQYKIARNKGTERAFCGGLLNNKEHGVYACIGCNLPLFESGSKFESGTGWPSFFKPIAKENVAEERDTSYGMVRVEILCARCDAHLGHVFDDGPAPTGMRYCLNSESLKFVADDKLATIGEKPASATKEATPATTKPSVDAGSSARPAGQLAEAVFAGGCFWCVEAVFEQLDGVKEVISGYSGGSAATANYEAVCGGDTGHAEAVKIVYDPAKINLEHLLKVHFATHDPTTLNRQGNDRGTQYRSAIFYANDEQKQIAQAFIADLTEAKVFSSPIVTTLEPLKAFYPAEAYHQDYAACNLSNPYIRAIALPKVEKVRSKFKDMLKPAAAVGSK